MSYNNLLYTDIGSVNIVCTLSGALTGTTTINFKRLDNIVYLSFNSFSGTASASPTITITPNTAIPIQFAPISVISRPVYVVDNGVTQLYQLLVPVDLSAMSISRTGNFSGTSGLLDYTVIWRTLNA